MKISTAGVAAATTFFHLCTTLVEGSDLDLIKTTQQLCTLFTVGHSAMKISCRIPSGGLTSQVLDWLAVLMVPTTSHVLTVKWKYLHRSTDADEP